MTCPVCSADNEASASFCYRCGSSLKPTTAAVGPTVQLDRGATPPTGSEAFAPSTEEEHSARVYDAPSPDSGASPAAHPAEYAPPPQYVVPPQEQSSAPMYYQPSMTAQQSSTALVALILGIVSFLGLSLLTAIPAIIVGRNARQEIEASRGTLTGDGMAQAGIVLGWINVALSVAVLCISCSFFALAIMGISVMDS